MRQAVLGLAILALAAAGSARAGTFLDDLQSSKGVTVTLGAEARMTPRYEGSAKYEFVPVPLFDLGRSAPPRDFIRRARDLERAYWSSDRSISAPSAISSLRAR